MIVLTTLLLLSFFTIATQLNQGDVCTVPGTREKGNCTYVEHCEYAKKLLKENRNPQFCGFDRQVPLVCCPESEPIRENKVGAVSEQMCFQYYDRRKQVYAIDLGQKALSKEFPHMAAVGYGENKTDILWLCGGTLISHYFVLTAAHCVYSKDFGHAKWVRLGDLDLKNTTEDANPIDLAIAQTFVHPGYTPSSHYHDVALFKMEKFITFLVYFKPACLNTQKIVPVDTLQATGWGKQGLFGEASSHLMKANLTVVSHAVCAKKYATVSTRALKKGIIDQHQICAGDAMGSDTCPGDSGGPLHYRQSGNDTVVNHFVVVGITSFGKGCGGENSVGVYTRVSSYVGWIENIVWPEELLYNF